MSSIRTHVALAAICAAVCLGVTRSAARAAALLQGQAAHGADQLRAPAGRPISRAASSPSISSSTSTASPTWSIQNMDGAGGLVGAQYLGEVAAKDGTVLGALTGTAWIYASDPARWRVDFRHYEFVARSRAPPSISCAPTSRPDQERRRYREGAGPDHRRALPPTRSKDLRMRLGSTCWACRTSTSPAIARAPPARLALQRGEIHMFSESPPSYRSVVVPQLVTPGIAIPVCSTTRSATRRRPSGAGRGAADPVVSAALPARSKAPMPSGDSVGGLSHALRDEQRAAAAASRCRPARRLRRSRRCATAVERLRHDKEFAAEVA